MQILNGKKGHALHDQAKQAVGKAPAGADRVDFWAPLNEMDPLTKAAPAPMAMPKFKFKVFHLGGPRGDPGDYDLDSAEYGKIMQDITEGRCHVVDENTYHNKDGDIRVFLRWLELPKEMHMTTLSPPTDEELDLKIEKLRGEKEMAARQEREAAKNSTGKKSKKKEPDAATYSELGEDPSGTDPEITM